MTFLLPARQPGQIDYGDLAYCAKIGEPLWAIRSFFEQIGALAQENPGALVALNNPWVFVDPTTRGLDLPKKITRPVTVASGLVTFSPLKGLTATACGPTMAALCYTGKTGREVIAELPFNAVRSIHDPRQAYGIELSFAQRR